MKFCVSLTTLPSRIDNIKETLNSIQKQTLQPDRIYLNLPLAFKRLKDQFFKQNQIDNLKDYELQISRCEDFGPGTNLMC